MKIKTSLVSGIFFIIVGVVLLLLMPSQVVVNKNIPFLESAKVAPFLSLMIMIIGGAILIVQSVVFKKETVIEVEWITTKYALIVIAFLAGYAFAIYLVGFLIASLLLMVAMIKFFNVKSKKQMLAIGIVAVVVYVVFTSVFRISLPGIGGVFLS